MMASRRSAGLAPRGRHIAARVVLRLAACGLAVGWAAGAAAQPAPPPSAAATRDSTPAAPLFRVILSDGSAIASYGEWARVGDRIVFTMPIGDLAGEPMLQLVSLPGAAVDWAATERYAHGVRYDHYVATRADTDFAEFSGHITELLKEVSLASEPVRRLELAERARRELAIWPREHYGYRAADLREIEEMLDATVSELRAAAGVRAFDLDLVAAVESPAMPLLPDPSPAQSIGQAMAVARLADSPAERQALLTAVVAAIDGGRAGNASGWLGLVRGDALSELAAERATDEAYARLAAQTVAAARWRAARGDVTGVEAIEQRARREDGRLGHRRPDQLAALIATLDSHLEAARRLRLIRDHWEVMRPLYRAYARDIDSIVQRLRLRRASLEAIRREAGPAPADLAGLIRRLRRITEELAAVPPPTDLAMVHAQYRSAAALALQAAEARQQAVYAADQQRSRDAAAAAAGSLMLLDRARTELTAALQPPGR